jgi:hypothetical protein
MAAARLLLLDVLADFRTAGADSDADVGKCLDLSSRIRGRFRLPAGKPWRLATMRERAATIGGLLKIVNSATGGTEVQLSIPIIPNSDRQTAVFRPEEDGCAMRQLEAPNALRDRSRKRSTLLFRCFTSRAIALSDR